MSRDVSRTIVYAGAVTCGALVALATHILISAHGLDLGALWRDPAAARRIDWALAWWLVTGAGFLASWLCVRLLQSGTEHRAADAGRWILGLVLVVVLASAGRGGAVASTLVAQTFVNGLAALGLGTVAAALAGYFAVQR